MRLAFSFAHLAILLALAGPSAALDLDALPPARATAIDTLLYREETAALERDFHRADSLQREMFAIDPASGAALREVAFTTYTRGEIPSLFEQLDAGNFEAVPVDAPLREEAREFLLGYTCYLLSRYRSAQEHLEAALARKPEWGWAHLVLARAMKNFGRPTREWEVHLRAALRDSSSARHALVFLADQELRHALGPVPDQALEALARYREIPGVEERIEREHVRRRLERGNVSPALLDSLWDSYRGKYGVWVGDLSGDFADYATRYLLPEEALSFFSRHIGEGEDRTRWEMQTAYLYELFGFLEEADSVFARIDSIPHYARPARLGLALRTAEADRLLRLADESLSYGPLESFADLAENAYRELALAEKLKELRRLLSEENPVVLARERLDRMKKQDIQSARALLDSLDQAGADWAAASEAYSYVAEATGDTVPPEAIFRGPVLKQACFEAIARAEAAYDRGHIPRARRLARTCMEKAGPHSTHQIHLLSLAMEAGDKELAQEIIDGLLSAWPGSPAVTNQQITLWLLTGEMERARREIGNLSRRSDLPPTFAAMLIRPAELLGEQEEADRLAARAWREGESHPVTRYWKAWMHLERREMDRALELLRPLVDDFPGRRAYRDLLISAGGAVHPLSEFQRETDEELARVFDYDLQGTEWIVDRMKDPTEVKDAEAIYLLRRMSYNIERTTRYDCRERFLLQVLSEEAVSVLQTMRIPFEPRNGAPRILVARVISPEGDATDSPLSDVLIAAPQEEDVDVSDTRHLVIPFPNLHTGSVIDLVFEESNGSFFGSGWCFRHLFGSTLPVAEEILELRVGDGVPVTVYTEEAPEGGTSAPGENARTYRWALRDLEPRKTVEYGPDWHDLYPWVGCTTYSSWEEAGTTYGMDFWRQVDRTGPITELAEKRKGERNEPAEIAESIFRYVSTEVRSLAIELDRGRMIPTLAGEVLRRGYGDCKDKVALFVSLLDALGIEARPVLVNPIPGSRIHPEFVELSGFTHMIAYLPHIDGGIFCDPMLGFGCMSDLPPSLSGRLGLVIPRDGRAELAPIRGSRAEEHGYEMLLEIRPVEENQARIDVSAVYRGKLASYLKEMMSVADTGSAGRSVDRLLAYGLWASCVRRSWEYSEDSCAVASLTAVYEDTLWSEGQAKTVPFQLETEVADPLLGYPDAEEREAAMIFPFPFRNRVELRFHSGHGWKADEKIAPLAVEGPFYAGRIRSETGESEGERYVSVIQTFELASQEASPEEYRLFREDWTRFLVGIYQQYHYRHALEEKRIAELEAYVGAHPEDAGFALQAAQLILGSDTGGGGEEGKRRRDAARRILRPFLGREEAGVAPFVSLASVEAKDQNYRLADSLATAALEQDPSNLFAMMLAWMYKKEMDDREGEVELLYQIVSQTGNPAYQSQLISVLYALDRDEEAVEMEDRMMMLQQQANPAIIYLARFQGFSRGERFEEADSALAMLKGNISEELWEGLRVDLLLNRDQLEEATVILERLWKENPVSPVISNNLAWTYALLGRNLDRAEELIYAATILSEDRTGERNTLGAIYARQGRWEEAREVFLELFESDDRPSNRIVNGYFLGLCEHQLGRREEAARIWTQSLEIDTEPRWRRRIEESLQRDARGEPVADLIFTP